MRIKQFNLKEISVPEMGLIGGMLLIIILSAAISRVEFMTVTYKENLPLFEVTKNVSVSPTIIKEGKTQVKVSGIMSVVREKEKDTKVVIAKDTILQVRPQAKAIPPAAKPGSVAVPQITPPTLLNQAMPAYPDRAIEEGLEGTVILRVLVLKNGRAGEVKVESSSGYSLLDNSAIAATQTWKFSPAKRNKEILEAWFRVPIKFQLKT